MSTIKDVQRTSVGSMWPVSLSAGKWLLALALVWLALPTVHATETVTYYLTDAQGTVLATEDAQGNTIAQYDYRPYGLQQDGPTTAGPGYTGHVNDPDTGLVYMQARYYDPATQRFLSVDPVGPTPGNIYSFNRYAYANNNPITNIDPDGRQSDEDGTEVAEDFYKARQASFERPAPPPVQPLDSVMSELYASDAKVLKEISDPGSGARALDDAIKAIQNGRSGKQSRLRQIASDPKASSADRGWIKNESRQIKQGNRSTIRNPPGKDLAHERGREASKGYSYRYSNLQDRDTHRTQHKFDDFGRKNKERPKNDK